MLGRALVAIALTIAFYLFALAVAGALIGFPVSRYAGGHGFPLIAAIPMVLAALTILRAIAPRREPFTPGGPALTREAQPELVELVEEVARRVGHPMPDAMHLEPDVNAGVAEVGPPLLPKRRHLVIGLPVLELLSVDQLRAVLAHEFGHYVGGDTRIGRWVYRTRGAVLRTVEALDHDDAGFVDTIVRGPFVGYASLFLRITAAISRRQEYAADALAMEVAGRDAHVGALRRMAAGAPAFAAFWEQELVPALEGGVRPPIGEGFRRFLTAETIDREVEHVLGVHLEQDRHDPYDSHPTLRQRLEAAGADPGEEPADGGPPAATLLRDPDEVERALLVALAGDEALQLRAGSWEDAERTWLERYEWLVGRLRDALDGRKVGDAPALVTDLPALARELRRIDEGLEDDTEARALALDLVGAATVLALVRRGLRFESRPGEPIRCAAGGVSFCPFEELAAIAGDEEPADRYRERLVEAGVADEPLDAVERAPA